MNLKLQTQNAKPVTRLYQLPNAVTLASTRDTVMVNGVPINSVNMIQSTGANLAASGAALYRWSCNNGAEDHYLSDTVGSSVSFIPTTAGTYIITVKGRNCKDCPSLPAKSDTIVAVNFNQVAITTNMTADSKGVYSADKCAGTAKLIATVPDPTDVKYYWAPDNGLTKPGASQSTITGDTVIAAPLEITTYTLTAVDTVTGWFSIATIKVAPSRSIVLTAADSSLCAGDTLKLAATVPPGFTAYSWYNESEHKPLTGSGSMLKIPYGNSDYPYGNSDISLKAADSSGCALKDLVFVTVSPSLAVDYAKDTICYGEDDYEKMQITVKGAEAVKTVDQEPVNVLGVYSWFPKDSVSFVRINQNGEVQSLKIKTTNTFIIKGIIDTSADSTYCIGDTSKISFTINVKGEFPKDTISPLSATILKGCSTQLIAKNNQVNSVFTWSPGAGLDKIIGDTVMASPDETTTYYVTSQTTNSNSYGCCGFDKVVVNVVDANDLCTNCGTDYIDCSEAFSGKTLTAPSLSGCTYQWQIRVPCDTFKDITGATSVNYIVSSWNYSSGSLCVPGTMEALPSNSYRVKVTGSLSCTLYSKIQRFYTYNPPYSCRLEATEVKEQVSDELLVYPNPTTGSFMLQFNNVGIEESGRVKIYSITGVKIFDNPVYLHEGVNNLNFTFKDNLPAGLYLLEVRTGSTIMHGRISKNKF